MPTVRYEFVASGAESVERAFEGIEKSARRQKRAVEESARATQRATRGPGGASAQDRKFKEAERAAAKYEKEAQREVKAAERAAAQKVKAEERAATAKTRANERAAAKEASAHERAQKHVARIKDRHFLEEQRKAERTANEAARKKVAAEKRAAAESRRSREKSFGVLKDAAIGGGLAAAAAGTMLIGTAARQAFALDDMARGIAISGRKSGEQFTNHDALRRGISRTAIENKGVGSEDIAAGVASYQALTGKTKQAIGLQGTFATVASASGGSAVDVAEAAASLSESFDISSIEDMQEAMAALVAQGKEGAVELKDVASLFQRLAAAGSSFGLPKGIEGVRMLGGMTQLAKTGTGSPEQAATAVENIFSAFTNKQKDLQAIGVNVFDKKTGKAKAFEDLMAETIGKAGGNDMAKKKATLSKIFDVMGGRGVNPLTTTYMDAFNKGSGTDAEKQAAAMSAVREKILASANAASTWSDVQQDAAMRQKSASAQITGAWESIKAKTADALLPAIAKLAEKLGGEESILDPFIEATGLAAEALVGLHDFLEGAGLIQKKQKSKVQIADEAQRALETFEKKPGADPLSSEYKEKWDKLAADAAAAKDAVFEKTGTSGKGLSKEEFVKQYMAAGGIAAEDRGSVDMLAGALQKDQTGARSNDFFQRVFGGENQAQQDIRHQFESAEKAKKTIGQDQAAQDLQALAAAARDVAPALQKMATAGQGSIVTGQ
jgi:hypothetical protein